MPLFEFRCPTCREQREVLARSRDAVRPPRCPTCGVAMTREWAPVATVSRSGGTCAAPRGGFS